MKKKTFDCVKMKREAANRIYEQTKGMSLEEREAWWREKHQRFLERQKSRRSTITKSGQ